MKKKMYIAPSCEVVEMEFVSMIATSPNIDVEVGDDLDYGTTGTNKHRGEWGNLWRTNE